MKSLTVLMAAVAAGSLSINAVTADAQQMQPQQQQTQPAQPQTGQPGQQMQRQEQMGQPGQMQRQDRMSGQELSSEAVRELQQSLNQTGFDAGEVDGIWGPRTEGALRDFQQDQGLGATGQIDEETLQALDMDYDMIARDPAMQRDTGQPGAR